MLRANGCWVTGIPVAWAESASQLSAALAAEFKRPVEDLGAVDWDEFFKERGVAALLGVPALEALGRDFQSFWLIFGPRDPLSISIQGDKSKKFAASDTDGIAACLLKKAGAEHSPVSMRGKSLIGYKCGWLVVKGASLRDIRSVLRGKSPKESDVGRGLTEVAVNPKAVLLARVGNWTIAVGQELLGDGTKAGVNRIASIVQQCSENFGEAQGFGTSRVADYGYWIRCISGRTHRLFAYCEGQVMLSVGRRLKEERVLGFGEEAVLHIAATWGLDVRDLPGSQVAKAVVTELPWR